MNVSADGMQHKKIFPVVGATRRLRQGTFASLLGEGMRALEHLLLVPIFLYAWGDTIYGEWLIVFSAVAYLSFADIGMSNFVINRMLQRYAVGDQAGYQKTLWSAWHLYRWIMIALIVPLFIFSFVVPFTAWFHITHVSDLSFRIAVFLLGLYFLGHHFPGLLSGVYISCGEYARWRTLLAIQDGIIVLLFISALLFGGGIITLASIYLVLAVLFGVIIYFDIRRRHPELQFFRAREYTDKKLAKTFFLPGLIFLLIPFANFIKIQGGILLAGSFFGGAVVALFGIHRTLANLVPRGINIVLPALQHEVTAAMERQDIRKVQETHNVFFKAVFAISVSAAAVLFVAGKMILTTWTSGKIEFHPILWVLLLADAFIYSIWQASSRFQIATNRYRRYAAIRILSACVGLFLAALLVRHFGLPGIVAGFLLPEIFINFTLVPYLTLKVIGESGRRFANLVGTGMILLMLQLLASLAIMNMIDNQISRTVLAVVVVVVVGAGFTLIFWFSPRERELFRAVSKVPLV